ncbi:Bacterial Ig-like domain (group 2) [compost metagenome]
MYNYEVVVYKIVPVTGVKLSDEIIELLPGETRIIDVTILPKDATNKNFTAASADTSIATVIIPEE